MMLYTESPCTTQGMSNFTLDPGFCLDEETAKATEEDLKKTGARVTTKYQTVQGKEAPFFWVEASSPVQAAAVRETAQRLGYKP